MRAYIRQLTAALRNRTFSRRSFLQGIAGGAFVLGCYVPLRNRAVAEEPAAPAPVTDPNVFLRIDADDSVTILLKHFEMGQGVSTGLATLIAEELEADWAKIRFEFAPNDARLYNNLFFGPVQATGGSTSIANSWEQLRKVGAAARMMFEQAAAARWGVPASAVRVEKGIVSHAGSDRSATFGELAAEAMQVPVPRDVALKAPVNWKLIGAPLPRLDSPGKTTGTAQFAIDVRRPGMLVAVIRRPEQFGATVASFDAAQARRIDGVVDVVQVPGGVAVLANDTWSAMRGRDAVQVSWDVSKAETRSVGAMLAEYRELARGAGLSAVKRGDAAAGLERADRILEAEYVYPFLAHAPMEPLNCAMQLHEDGAEIWSGCQLQSIDEYVAAQVLGLTPDKIKIHTLLAGGSFGRRGNPVADWVAELAAVTKAINGRAPVQLVWTREDDIRGGYYRPLVLHQVRAGLDAAGRITGWHHKIVNKSIFTGTPFESVAVHDGVDHSSVEGVADTPYAIGDFSVESYNVQTPVPVLWWRSVGHSCNGPAIETIIDELAHLAGKDPVAFRANLLQQHPRDRAVLDLAAEKAGWGGSVGGGRGRGVACHRSFGTRVAMVADVSVHGAQVKVDRIVAAVDCGIAVNPDIVTAQIEGAVGFVLSAALRNQITLDEGRVRQSNFHDFEPTRIREMPAVEVHIVRSGEAPSGIGEPGVPPVAPAIGNAIFAATGKRLRSLPFDLKSLI